MTGYAQAASGEVTVTIKSWNQRHLDPHWQVPTAWEGRVPDLATRLKAAAHRGRIEVRVHVAATPHRLDPGAVEAYLAGHAELSRRLGASSPPTPADVLRFPGVFVAEAPLPEPAHLDRAFAAALEQWNHAREAEGRALLADLAARLDRIARFQAEAAVAAATVAAELRQRLAGASPEVVAQAERSDVTEELVRLAAHLGQARALLAAGGEVGKKLDFLAQELNREATTLLAKPSGASPSALRLAELGLDLKVEIEKIREQAQNLE